MQPRRFFVRKERTLKSRVDHAVTSKSDNRSLQVNNATERLEKDCFNSNDEHIRIKAVLLYDSVFWKYEADAQLLTLTCSQNI